MVRKTVPLTLHLLYFLLAAAMFCLSAGVFSFLFFGEARAEEVVREETVRVKVLYGRHRTSVSRADATAIFDKAAGIVLRGTGVRVKRIGRLRRVRVRRVSIVGLHSRERLPYSELLSGREGRTFLLAPPLVDKRQPTIGYSAGAAPICGSFGFASVTVRRGDRTQSMGEAAYLVAHELGHHLGATHDFTGMNVMHPGAYILGLGVPWRERAIREIEICSKR